MALINGNVLTMNSVQPSAEAIAVNKDRIAKVGTNKEINALIGKDTKVINLKGKTVVPGLVDSHIHVADFGRVLTWINLKDVNSIEEMQSRLRERTKKITKGRWIIGNGWDENRFIEKRYPNRGDLDEVAPENPVIFYHQCERVCVVNSMALEMTKITKETEAPLDGTIERNVKTDEPTGVLREDATDLVWKKIPEPNEEELIEGAKLAFERIVEAGVTGINWIVTSPSEVSVIHRMTENKLPLRAHLIVPEKILNQLDASDSRLITGVEISIDGFLAARTAAMHKPYVGDSAAKGNLLYTQEELNALVAKVHKTNFRLVIHAMGDQAIDMALTAIEKALTEAPRESHRHRIEHASVLNKDLIERIKKLGIIVSVQPKCVISEFSVWSAVDRLGPERARWLYPLKTLNEEGIKVIGGSDCPMEPLSPLQAIQAAVTRQFFPEEQITVNEALRMYTINAAYATSEEKIKGSVEEGKLADLTVLSTNPQTTSPKKIGNINVESTIVGGKVVYKKLA